MDYVLDLDFAVFQMSAVTICVGILLCVIITCALYARRGEGITGPLALSVLSLLFGVLFSRFLHWYFTGEVYASFKAAFTDFNRGSFCLQGMFLGIWLAAFLVKKLRLTGSIPALLDAAAPGVCLLVAFIRLSALFNTTCRGRITIKTKLFQRLPFAVASTDAAGNVTYRFASFFIMALLTLLRMTVLSDAHPYRANALMNANLFALGAAFFLFGLFNWVFVGGFYRTAYRIGRPFVVYLVAAFLSIGVFEALHHVPGLEGLNAFGTEHIGMQILLFAAGLAAWLLMTLLSCRRACANFERIDL
jgi:prolipoprotein diacylglyceryltransferase